MDILTNKQIDKACNQVVDGTDGYADQLHMAFQIQYATGCRESEAIAFDQWGVPSDEFVTLQPFKRNQIRMISLDTLPPEFVSMLSGTRPDRFGTSVERMRSAFMQFQTFGMLIVGKKGISTHLFRYNRMRIMADSGSSVVQIRQSFGLSADSVVERYLNNPVFGNP